MTAKAETRVRIARDVIAQIKAGRFVAMVNRYFRCEVDGYADTDVKTATAGKQCHVCALGSLFASTIDRFNSLELPAIKLRLGTGRDETEAYLSKYFSPKQLDIIEAAYEGEKFGYAATWEEARSAIQNFAHYTDNTHRMVAIMRNIIRNGGTFKPADEKGRRTRPLATVSA